MTEDIIPVFTFLRQEEIFQTTLQSGPVQLTIQLDKSTRKHQLLVSENKGLS